MLLFFLKMKTLINFSKLREFCSQNKPIKIALYIYIFIFPVLLFLTLEMINPASSAGLFADGMPNLWILFFSYGLITALSIGIYAIIGSVAASYSILSFVLLIGYITNYMKLAVTGGVFVPSDIFLAGAAFQVANPGVVTITMSLVVGVLLVVLINLPLFLIKTRIRFVFRIAALPVIIALLIFTGDFMVNRIFRRYDLNWGTVSERYRDNGMLLGFYAEVVGINHFRLDSIAFEETSIFRPFIVADSPGIIAEERPPNVIVIMSESFMDPTTMPNLSFSQYPIPNFRRLSENNLSGNVLVPVFGGGTINTEMEFLLGIPHLFYGSRFYVPAENPYRYFFREIPTALPWLFRHNGYRSVAIHTFYGTFFNRNSIYNLIGFDEFIASEQMPDAVNRGPFISDEYFTDRIIEQIILAEQDDVPLFLFGISMQNHWEFDPMKYGTLDLDVMSDSPYLGETELQHVNSFLQGIFDADKQLGRLADFVESRDTPTIIVFFGDHLPILGRHADRIFEGLGFVSYQDDFRWTVEDRANILMPPYLVWANYDLGQNYWGDMSTFFLGAKVAEASGIMLNRHFTYLLRSSEYFNGITNELYIGADGTFNYGWQYRSRPHVQALEALWYANMFGTGDFHASLAELGR